MRRTFEARNRVAIAGYAQSPVTRHAGCSLGALSLETARRGDRRRRAAGRPDRRVRHAPASFPPRAATRVEDGMSIVSANWLAQRLGVEPGVRRRVSRASARFTGAVAMAVNAVASGAADHVLVHRALHNPAGQLPRQPDDGSAGGSTAVDRTARVLRPVGHDRVAVQRVPPALRRRARVDGPGRRRGPQERRPHPVVLLVRAAAHGRGLPCGARRCSTPCAASTATSPSTASPCLRAHLGRAGPKISPIGPSTSRGMPAACPSGGGCRCTGPSTTSWKGGRAGAAPVGSAPGSVPTTSTSPRSTTGSHRSSGSGWRPRVLPGGRGPRFIGTVASTATVPGALPVLSGGGALGNGRMHGVPQMLECYLQLSSRAGRTSTRRHVGGTRLSFVTAPRRGRGLQCRAVTKSIGVMAPDDMG